MAMAVERTILLPLFEGSRTPEEFRAAVRAVSARERLPHRAMPKKAAAKKTTVKKTTKKPK